MLDGSQLGTCLDGSAVHLPLTGENEHPVCFPSQPGIRTLTWEGLARSPGTRPCRLCSRLSPPSASSEHPDPPNPARPPRVLHRVHRGPERMPTSVPSLREPETHVSPSLHHGTSFLFGVLISSSSQTKARSSLPPPNDSRAMSKFWKGSFPLQSSSRVHMTSGLLKSIPADYTSVVLTSGPLGVACTTHLPQPRLHYTQLIRETFCGSQQLSGAPCLVSVHKGFICLSPRGSGQVRLLGDGPVHLETSHIVSFALERSDSERLRSIADSKLTLHFPPLASAP